jgi:hypothetical protein
MRQTAIGEDEMVHMESFHKKLQVKSGLMWRMLLEHGNKTIYFKGNIYNKLGIPEVFPKITKRLE